ncbi:hypothetical protein KQX54_012640 [Cotesia glomerata]|uniref:Uncharacterized protein n=1 Tax=Cotesia glomerata TaxID=32391 RepID=A0AAV7IZ39_COTGL|nr:hypothetical protein KQX54_012640 [Cotesia glomerata]
MIAHLKNQSVGVKITVNLCSRNKGHECRISLKISIAELERVMIRTVPYVIDCSKMTGDVYSAIKKCCLDHPVPSHVILQKNWSSEGAMSIANKLATEFHCKIGGAS